ncbi:EamA family transporter RarD [Ammoniphilus resinae]|uniref:Chloramphenicol-sensitive protein RarD n=1 Tax=Ammoniphilus resinae TaxID=861532 RepID=A0ABS4GTX8_9BACL|nr:EamA family transporter RarD [Ammoniphilus resinae]MBP1933736.1 chloramphenicol-sensitive protein RarD [Ammoniphilus resinae]
MDNQMNTSGQSKAGLWYALAAYVSWGLLPIYWKLLEHIPSGQILAHRIAWSFVFVAILLFLRGRWGLVKEVLSDRKSRYAVILCGFTISINWFLFIWAVNHNHIVEASLGYYINPLISIAVGVVILKERLHFWQTVSLVLAAIGVLFMTVQLGKIPWIALTLAVSFAFYSLAKKLVKFDAMTGLALETLVVVPVALIYLFFVHSQGNGAFGGSWTASLLLMVSGVVTAYPLLWFAQAAKRVPLSTIGFIQYLSPTVTLLLGVFLYHEPFTKSHLMSYSFIWIALVLYSLSFTKWFHQKPEVMQKRESV